MKGQNTLDILRRAAERCQHWMDTRNVICQLRLTPGGFIIEARDSGVPKGITKAVSYNEVRYANFDILIVRINDAVLELLGEDPEEALRDVTPKPPSSGGAAIKPPPGYGNLSDASASGVRYGLDAGVPTDAEELEPAG